MKARAQRAAAAAVPVAASPRFLTAGRRKAQLLLAALARAEFSPAALTDLLGLPDARLAPPEQQALWAFRTRARMPLALLARLFVLGGTASAAEARLLFGRDLEPARRAGVLLGSGAGVRAGLSLALPDGLPMFADAAVAQPGRDYVPGPTRASLVLAAALPAAGEREGNAAGPRRALDLGTGPGYLALRLAGVAGEIVGADVSSRALGLAALNHAVNLGLGTIAATPFTWLESDRFAALGTQRFDLVVGNLPFVVSPDRRFVYRDGGLPEDGFTADIVGRVGRYLVEGGCALLLGQWVHREGEPEDERLAPWFVKAGCDALVLRLEAEPAELYAARWSAGPGADVDHRTRTAALARWVADFRRRRIQGVSTGIIVLRRRRAAAHLMSIDDVSAERATPSWAEISARLAKLSPGRG